MWWLGAGGVGGLGTVGLEGGTRDLARSKRGGRDKGIITPHCAFDATTAIEDLERLSGENIVHFLNGEKDKVFKLVNEV